MDLVQIKYQPERSLTFLGSPSIVRLPNNTLLVSHDYFGPSCPRNHEDEECLTSIYRSHDDGQNWQNIAHVVNAFWSTLFTLGESVYLFGTSQQYGSIVIRKSDDGGYTWTQPLDKKNGILFQGGSKRIPPNYHCAPVAVLQHEGRIYKAFEDCDPMDWGTGFQACVVSAPINANLLCADSWRMSNRLPFNPNWTPSSWGPVTTPGWREGNVVAGPDGQLWDVLTFEARHLLHDVAAMIRIDDEGTRLFFDQSENHKTSKGFINLPGGKAKFTLRRDLASQNYLTLSNILPDPNWLMSLSNNYTSNTDKARTLNRHIRQRNVMALCASKNLYDWKVIKVLLVDDSGLEPEDSVRLTGYQYVDWQIDGNDLIYVVRTASRGARNFHDSNRILFGREKNFRALL